MPKPSQFITSILPVRRWARLRPIPTVRTTAIL